jgi:Uma2 family endonuclease
MARNLRQPDHHYTIEEYFALDKASDRRYEYWDGEIVCMSGGTLAHGQISRNLFRAIDKKLEGGSCQAFTGDMAIRTPAVAPYRYPDVSAICGELQIEQVNGIDTLVNPALIAEVLSPTTEDRDRNEKRIAYQAIPSLSEYLIVSQDIPHITHYVRDGQSWARTDYSQKEAAIRCASIGATLTVAEIYQGVAFE